MKVSLVQTNPQPNRALNLEQTRALMEEACRTEDPDLIVLPEYFEAYGISTTENWPWPNQPAPPPTGWPVISPASIACSSMPAPSWRKSSMSRASGTRPLCSTGGREVAAYRKIHMFDIVAPDGSVYRESDTVKPGGEIVTYDIDGLRVGCAICYDIRFAELFLHLAKAGCDVIVLPAAFTLQTGKDHWEVLARARAIETQAYFIACGQTGAVMVDGERRACYGHSLVCDPWGHTIARASDGVGLVSARIDRRQIARVRGLIPMAQHRRLACG